MNSIAWFAALDAHALSHLEKGDRVIASVGEICKVMGCSRVTAIKHMRAAYDADKAFMYKSLVKGCIKAWTIEWTAGVTK